MDISHLTINVVAGFTEFMRARGLTAREENPEPEAPEGAVTVEENRCEANICLTTPHRFTGAIPLAYEHHNNCDEPYVTVFLGGSVFECAKPEENLRSCTLLSRFLNHAQVKDLRKSGQFLVKSQLGSVYAISCTAFRIFHSKDEFSHLYTNSDLPRSISFNMKTVELSMKSRSLIVQNVVSHYRRWGTTANLSSPTEQVMAKDCHFSICLTMYPATTQFDQVLMQKILLETNETAAISRSHIEYIRNRPPSDTSRDGQERRFYIR